MKQYILLFLLLLCVSCIQQRYIDIYSVTGVYNKKSAQGMAVYKGKIFLLNDQGFCRVYDLIERKNVGNFPLSSANKNNHANCASFGTEYPVGNREFPALYVSECRKPYRCFVENVTMDSAMLIQTLRYGEEKETQVVHNWIVDREERKLYAVSRMSKAASDSVCITRFRLPFLIEGNVTFKEKDVEERFCVMFPNLLQGGTIRNGYLYLSVGLHTGNEGRKDAERAIVIIDLRKRSISRIVSLQDKVVNEPEDVDFYGNNLLLFCGQTGGIYPINVK